VVYALFSKIGIKCEIHDCTIMLFEFLFKDSFPEDMIRELKLSKRDRIEAQYYTAEVFVDTIAIVERTKIFVLEIEKVIDKLNRVKTEGLRAKIENIHK